MTLHVCSHCLCNLLRKHQQNELEFQDTLSDLIKYSMPQMRQQKSHLSMCAGCVNKLKKIQTYCPVESSICTLLQRNLNCKTKFIQKRLGKKCKDLKRLKKTKTNLKLMRPRQKVNMKKRHAHALQRQKKIDGKISFNKFPEGVPLQTKKKLHDNIGDGASILFARKSSKSEETKSPVQNKKSKLS